MSYHRRDENRPVLTGRAARRRASRVEARTVAREHGTPVIGHHQRALVAAANAGHVLVRDYLLLLGLSAEFVAKYESAAGRKIAATYRATYHRDPNRGGKAIVRGRVFSTMRYSNPLDVIAGALNYGRTRDFVLASGAGHPVARQFAGA